MITYDDGDVKWHDMAEEVWLSEPAAKGKTGKEPASRARAKPAAASEAKAKPAAKAVTKPPDKSATKPRPADGSSTAATKRPASATAVTADDSSPPPKSKAMKSKQASGPAPELPAWARGSGHGLAPSPAGGIAYGAPPPAIDASFPLPSLVSLSDKDIEIFPCGVIKVSVGERAQMPSPLALHPPSLVCRTRMLKSESSFAVTLRPTLLSSTLAPRARGSPCRCPSRHPHAPRVAALYSHAYAPSRRCPCCLAIYAGQECYAGRGEAAAVGHRHVRGLRLP